MSPPSVARTRDDDVAVIYTKVSFRHAVAPRALAATIPYYQFTETLTARAAEKDRFKSSGAFAPTLPARACISRPLPGK